LFHVEQFPTFSPRRCARARNLKQNPDIEKVMEFECHVVKASLLKACGFILDSENQKYAIVDKAPIDCLPSEICIEEIEQEDANMIFKEVMELSQWQRRRLQPRRPFLKNRDLKLLLHRMAKTYGRLPSELLELDLYSFSLNLTVANAGWDAEERERAKEEKVIYRKYSRNRNSGHRSHEVRFHFGEQNLSDSPKISTR
jgi:hypothetical protein